jgi:acyl carrier protein
MTTQERVLEIVARVLNTTADNIRPEANLKDDLGATSLDRYTILMDVEDAFSLELDDIPEEDLEARISTVADIVNFLDERIG